MTKTTSTESQTDGQVTDKCGCKVVLERLDRIEQTMGIMLSMVRTLTSTTAKDSTGVLDLTPYSVKYDSLPAMSDVVSCLDFEKETVPGGLDDSFELPMMDTYNSPPVATPSASTSSASTPTPPAPTLPAPMPPVPTPPAPTLPMPPAPTRPAPAPPVPAPPAPNPPAAPPAPNPPAATPPTIPASLFEEMFTKSASVSNYAKNLVFATFPKHDLLSSNCSGALGKKSLEDDPRMVLIKEMTLRKYRVEDKDSTWRACRKAIDGCIRKLRMQSKCDQ